LNSDGKLDLVLGSDDLRVLLGNGNGTFKSASDFMEAGGFFLPAIGDLNGDGKLDVVTAGGNGSFVTVYLGKGNGLFQAPRNFNTAGTGGNVLSADFNGDGKFDLATFDSVMLGNGNGTFQAPIATSSVLGEPQSTADVNNDHIPDLIGFGPSRGGLAVLLGNGDGTFREAGVFDTGGSPTALSLGDFSGDGNLDAALLVGPDNPGNVSIMLGNGDGTFQSPVNYPTTEPFQNFVLNGDFNGDGKLDLIVGGAISRSNTLNLLLGNGDGTFRAPKVINAGGCVYGAVADLNGDKKLDIILAGCQSGDVMVLLGNGNGTFKNPVNYPAGVSGLLKVRDVNGDGKLDVIVPNTGNDGNKVVVLLGNGDGTLQPPQNYFVDEPATGIAVGDFNGDHLLDLAVGNSDHISILLNTGH
jgi:uncharacterized protein (DUF2141 family)